MLGVLLSIGLVVTSPEAVPAQYHGQWTQDLSACGGEDTRGVQITSTAITFYEPKGVVRRVSQGAKGISARVDFTGEGRSWSEAIRFHPLPRRRLELTALGSTEVYQRCPAKTDHVMPALHRTQDRHAQD